MKKKVLAKILILTVTAGMLTGCGGKKEVDYSLAGDTETGTESTENIADVGINDDSLEQFRDETEWNEQWVVTNKYNQKRNIRIEAEVVVPDLKTMRVLNTRILGGDPEFKEQCLESFFGADNEYYYHEEENYTREELEKWLPDETEMIANASDTRQVAQEFESVSRYAGYRDDILYEITLSKGMVAIYPNWEDENKCGPEEFRDYTYVDMGGIPIEGEENTCKYSEEEAQEIADNYLKEVGLSALECNSGTSLVWRGSETDISDEDTVKNVCYGYMFEYTTGIDGVSFDQFPEPWDFMTWYQTSKTESIPVYGGHMCAPQDDTSVGNCTARIMVTDDGIYRIIIENPQVIESTSNSVGLLSLDTIKGILQEEVMERTENYNICGYRVYNNLQLIYLKMSDEEKESVSAIPVWCLSYRSGHTIYDYDYDHPVFVNAIDGTIVHFADAEWKGIEIEDTMIPDFY